MRTALITLVTRLLRWVFQRRATPPVPNAPRSVLILKPCCLGDVLLTTPLVAAIRNGFPQTHITYAVGTWSRPMVATSPHIDAVLTLPDRWTVGSFLATARVLRSRQFDMVFVPERSPLFSLLTWFADIPVRVGFDSAGRGFAYTHRVSITADATHEADHYGSLAVAIGLPQPPRQLFFFPDSSALEAARTILNEQRRGDGPLILLHPGGGQNPGMTLPRKRWLPERWAAVADTLMSRYDACVILIGGPGDEEAVAAVASAMRQSPSQLVERWDWGVLGALIRQSDLFLGHDTGMMHLAMAVGTPTVAVFGPSDPQVYGPYGEHGTHVWRPTPESPCFYNGNALPECPCAMQCMRNVEVAEVVAAAEKFLRLKLIEDE